MMGTSFSFWPIIALGGAGLLVAFTFALMFFPHNRLLSCLTRPIRAGLIARARGVSFRYAYRVLALMDRDERGEVTEMEFLRAGHQIGEQHPNDYAQHVRYERKRHHQSK
jgi:hypothetical protein